MIAIEISDVTFRYENRTVLENINMNIPKASVFGFLGLNGAGKSTLIKIILGLLTPETGSVNIFGNNVVNKRMHALKSIGSFVEGPSLYPNMRVSDYLNIKQTLLGLPSDSTERVMEIVNLTDYKDVQTKKLSLGLKQRLCIAFALIGNPPVLILDEPSNGLDPEGIKDIRTLIAELNEKHNKTIFMSSHILGEVEKTCTHVAILDGGKIVFDQKMIEVSDNNYSFTIRTDNPEKSLKICTEISTTCFAGETNEISLIVNDENEISFIIERLIRQGVQVYTVVPNNKLEDIFFKYTGHAK